MNVDGEEVWSLSLGAPSLFKYWDEEEPAKEIDWERPEKRTETTLRLTFFTFFWNKKQKLSQYMNLSHFFVQEIECLGPQVFFLFCSKCQIVFNSTSLRLSPCGNYTSTPSLSRIASLLNFIKYPFCSILPLSTVCSQVALSL
jgi:hypothetical protein